MVDSRCLAVQESLVEQSGDRYRLTAAEQDHLSHCQACAAVAEAEQALGTVLGQSAALEEPQLDRLVLAAMNGVPLRRRLLTALPVAVSLLVATAGGLLMGGVPGSGAVRSLPLWSTQGWIALLQSAADWSVVLVTTAWAVSSELPLALPLVAGLIASAGLGCLAVAALRQRKVRAWNRAD